MNIVNNNQNPQPNQSNPLTSAHLKDAEWLVCEECGSKTFVEAMHIKKISKFLTGSERDSIAPMPVIACMSCGHVNEDMLPKL